MKKALITDIAGQNGSCLAEFLLSKRYEVHGIIRRASSINTNRIDHVYKDPQLADKIIPSTKRQRKEGNYNTQSLVDAYWIH